MDHETLAPTESMNKKAAIISRIPSFPPLLPGTLREAERLSRDPDVHGSRIAELIEEDSFLNENTLCLANALYFGFSDRADTVREAFSRLNGKSILPLLFASSVAKMVQESHCEYDLSASGLWEHLVGTAIGVRKLAECLKLEPPAYLFLAALTHDIGKIIFGAMDEVDAKPVIELALEERITFEQAEQRIIGIDHAEVGACLLEAWNLPARLLDVVRYHHRPEGLSDDTQLVDLVHVADALCMMAGVGASLDTLNYMPSPNAMSRLGVGMGSLESIVYEVLHDLIHATKK